MMMEPLLMSNSTGSAASAIVGSCPTSRHRHKKLANSRFRIVWILLFLLLYLCHLRTVPRQSLLADSSRADGTAISARSAGYNRDLSFMAFFAHRQTLRMLLQLKTIIAFF